MNRSFDTWFNHQHVVVQIIVAVGALIAAGYVGASLAYLALHLFLVVTSPGAVK